MSRPHPDKRLFTPGPLTTSRTVKEAMLHDASSRDEDFIELVRDIRRRLLALAGVGPDAGFEAILMQGSGTFAVEAVLSTALPRDGKLLVLVNGAYGERMVEMARRHQIGHHVLTWEEDTPVDPDQTRQALAENPSLTHVAVVQCETTSGILNPVDVVGRVVREAGRQYIIDAMSSFGVLPADLTQTDYLISSANKCIEGVPGFAFVLARRTSLEGTRGQARTLSLDLYDQWRGLESNGQFRFTPPTHAILAFAQALDELDAEGGPKARLARYRNNQQVLSEGMQNLGFTPYLAPAVQAPIITTFRQPGHPRFDFTRFHQELSRRGFVIYPGKLTREPCFRIGNIGRLDEGDMHALLAVIREVLDVLQIEAPIHSPSQSA